MSSAPELLLDATAEGVALWIHVTPRARRAQLGGLHDGALRVAVTEPPADGAANQACRRSLARALGVRRDAVAIDPGSRHRRKRVRIAGDPAALTRRLRALAAPGPTD
jgi:uncharacterized protein (TIGR00251 family)